MKKEKFVARLLDRDVQITSLRNRFWCPWNIRQQYASLTRFLDFGCDFKDGICYSYRKVSVNKEMCCCHSCFYSVGHFKCVNIRDLDILAERFKPDIGFWRKEGGCVLPRSLRSNVCLMHSCSPKSKSAVILGEILTTPWPYTGYTCGDTPEFIGSPEYYSRRPKQKWLSVDEMKEKILKESKNGDN